MKARNRGTKLSALFVTALFVALALVPSYGFSQASFFQGKTITVIQGRDPGGTGDLRVGRCSRSYRNIFRETQRL